MRRNPAAILNCGAPSFTIPASRAGMRTENGIFCIPASGWRIPSEGWGLKPIPEPPPPPPYYVYVTNEVGGDMTVIDGRTHEVVTTMPLGKRPRGLKVSRLARGVPVGGELEYVDAGTIARAMLDRRST